MSGDSSGAARIGGGSVPSMGNVFHPLGPVRPGVNPQNSNDAVTNASATREGHQRGNTGSDISMNEKQRPTDTDDGFSARDIA